MVERKKQSWDTTLHGIPKMLPVTGHHDTSTRVTYIPFSDAVLGLMGWEVFPHLGKSFLIYIMPVVGQNVCEIRVHSTFREPDPLNDRVIGTVSLPDDLFVNE
jgi:hypothetical protein